MCGTPPVWSSDSARSKQLPFVARGDRLYLPIAWSSHKNLLSSRGAQAFAWLGATADQGRWQWALPHLFRTDVLPREEYANTQPPFTSCGTGSGEACPGPVTVYLRLAASRIEVV
jgi:hypothetical protein